MEIQHSLPTWIFSPRGANPKFQAGIVLAGLPYVRDRLLAVQKLNGRLKTISGLPLLTSGHVLHEVKTRIRKYQRFNSPFAITQRELKAGISRGDYPRIAAVTAPAFGIPGVERGTILSSDRRKVQMAKDLHTEAIDLSQELKDDGLGEGITICWPAFDSGREDLLDEKPLSFEEAWKRMVDFWVEVLDETEGKVWLEWKPCDPGIDYICTLKLAIDFCNEVNKRLGRKAMWINNEWAHLLISGLSVEEGTQRTIEASLFTGFVHVNSSQLLPRSIEKMMEEGTPIEEIGASYDWDWAVGMGGKKRWDDQQRAVSILKGWDGGEKIIAEHDINPAGQDPIAFAERSIANLEEMWRD